MSGEEPRINVTISIRQSLYDKLKAYSEKNMFVPSVENMIRNIIDEWETKQNG